LNGYDRHAMTVNTGGFRPIQLTATYSIYRSRFRVVPVSPQLQESSRFGPSRRMSISGFARVETRADEGASFPYLAKRLLNNVAFQN